MIMSRHQLRGIAFLLFTAVFSVTSCIDEEGPAKTPSAFEQYVDSIPLLPLPFELSTTDAITHVSMKSHFIPDGAAIIGKLPSKNGRHLIIYSYPADIRLPVLEVYDHRGKRTHSVELVNYGACPITDNGYYGFRLANYEVIYRETTCDSFDSRIERDSITVAQVVQSTY